MSNNAPITIIDAHKSVSTDSPVTGNLVQSVDLLNSLLMEMMGGPPPGLVIPPLKPIAKPLAGLAGPLGLTQTDAASGATSAAEQALGPPTQVILGDQTQPSQVLQLAQVNEDHQAA